MDVSGALSDDEELARELAEQEAFLRSGKRPAASVQRVGRLPSEKDPAGARTGVGAAAAPRSASVSPGGLLPRHGPKDVIDGTNLPLLNPDAVFAPRKPPTASRAEPGLPEAPRAAVMGSIRERTLSVGAPRQMRHERGFPQAMHRDKIEAGLRAQLRAAAAGMTPATAGASAGALGGGIGGGGNLGRPSPRASSRLDAEIQSSGVDAENRLAVSSMSVEEIRSAQAKMMATMDPALIQKLRRRGAAAGAALAVRAGGGGGQGAGGAGGLATSMTGAATGQSSCGVGDAISAHGVPPHGISSPPTLEDLKLEWTRPADAPPLLDGSATAGAGSGGVAGAGGLSGVPAVATPDGSAEVALAAALRAAGMHEERFDFEGRLVTGERRAEEGLHHHGEQPDLAGYTMAELVHLSRSTVPAQRASSLRCLARCWEAQRTSKLGPLLRRWTRDADVAVLMRLSLDDSHSSAAHAALDAAAALSSLHGAPPASALLAAARPAQISWRGCEGPAPPPIGGAGRGGARGAGAAPGGGDAKSDGSDAEACREDLLKGWVKMGLTGRMRFMIESQALEPAAQQHALLLLCQCAHRSLALAAAVARTPRLPACLAALIRNTGGQSLSRDTEGGPTSRDTEGGPPFRDTEGSTLSLALLLAQLLASSRREAAAALLAAGVLPACHAVYVRAFPAGRAGNGGVNGGVNDGVNDGVNNTLNGGGNGGINGGAMRLADAQVHASAAAAVWRCLAAYGLTAPSLASWFPYFSRATHTAGPTPPPAGAAHSAHGLSAATFCLLETLCTVGEAGARNEPPPPIHQSGGSEPPPPVHPAGVKCGASSVGDAAPLSLEAQEQAQGQGPSPGPGQGDTGAVRLLLEAEAATAFGGGYRTGIHDLTQHSANGDSAARSLSDAEAALLTCSEVAESKRWRHAAAFVPAAVRVLMQPEHEDNTAPSEKKTVPPKINTAPVAAAFSSLSDARSVLSASCLHFLASFLQGLPRQISGASAGGDALQLLPWCETVTRVVMLPTALRLRRMGEGGGGGAALRGGAALGGGVPERGGGGGGALGWALGVLERAAGAAGFPDPAGPAPLPAGSAPGSSPPPPPPVSLPALATALEAMLAYVRLWWQLTRQHRGVLHTLAAGGDTAGGGGAGSDTGGGAAPVGAGRDTGGGRLGRGGAAEARQLLWRLCELLPLAVGPAGRGEAGAVVVGRSEAADATAGRGGHSGSGMEALHVLQLSGRLSFYVTQLIDAIDCWHTPTPLPAPAHPPASAVSAPASAATATATAASARSSEARLFLQLVACGLSWMRPGDESMAQAQVSALLLNRRWVDRAGSAFALAAEGGVQPPTRGSLDDSTPPLPNPALPPFAPAAPSESSSSLRPALLPTFIHLLSLPTSTAQAEAQARTEGRTDALACLRPSPDRSCLPLPADWLATPAFTYGIDARGSMEEEAMLAQLRAALGLLCAYSTEGGGLDHTAGGAQGSTAAVGLGNTAGGALAPLRWVPRSRLLCRGLQVFALPLSPWRDTAVARALDALLDVWCGDGGEGTRMATGSGGGDGVAAIGGGWIGSDLLGDETETDVTSLVRRMLDLYLAESMGSPTFTAWVLLTLRTAEPAALRLEAFGALDQLSHKLSVAPPQPQHVGAWAALAVQTDAAHATVCGEFDHRLPPSFEERLAPGTTVPPNGADFTPPTSASLPVPSARTAASLLARRSVPAGPPSDGDRLLELLEESLVRGNLGRAPQDSFLLRWAVHQLWAAAVGGNAPLLAARVEGWSEERLRMAKAGICEGE